MKNGMNSSPGSHEKNTRPLLTYSLGFAEMCAHRSGATSLYSSMRCIQYGTHPAPASRNAILSRGNRACPCRRETPVERDGERELVGGIDDRHVELILVHVREASPRIVGPHPAIVDGLALRWRQVAVDADEPDVRLGAPDFTVHESDDVATARLRVARTPLPILRVDPLVRCVDLDHVAVAIDHEFGLVSHGTLLGSCDASRESRPRSQS